MSNETAPKVIPAFGKFLANINGNVVTFDTEGEAQSAVVIEEQGEEFTARAVAYCAAREYADKNAAAKTRIVMDFMAFEASPVAEEVEETE